MEETLNSFRSHAFFEATGRLSSVQHVSHFCILETVLRCLLLKMLAGFIFSAASGAHRDLSGSYVLSGFMQLLDRVQLLERFGEIYSMLRWDSNLGWFKLKKLEFSPRTCCQITRLASPVYTLGFNCASLSSVLCICVVTHHGEYCEPATSTHLILNP